jgi:outer membrane receptor protein involved in Fe transport
MGALKPSTSPLTPSWLQNWRESDTSGEQDRLKARTLGLELEAAVQPVRFFRAQGMLTVQDPRYTESTRARRTSLATAFAGSPRSSVI